MGAKYTTREAVTGALDIERSSYRSAQVDRAIETASRAVDAHLNRHKHGLAPVTATRYFAWPANNYGRPWRLWLDENELISLTTLEIAGSALVLNTDFYLEPVNSGPPYTHIEINRSGSASFGGSSSSQRAIEIEAVWGHSNVQEAAGTLGEALDSSETGVDVTDGGAIGVGDMITVGSERMLVVDRAMVDTTVNLGSNMAVAINDRTVDVADGTQFRVGEVLQIDAEQMYVVSITGNNLTVRRGWDGTTLAAHTAGADIYASRTLTVERGYRGSTAAAHNSGDAVTRWVCPEPAATLCIAEAITILEQESGAYSRRIGSDEAERDASGTEVFSGRGLNDIRRYARTALGRKFRKRAV